MKKYVLTRLLKSVISILLVVVIVMLLLFKMVSRTKIFDQDAGYKKMQGDAKTAYTYTRWEELGYLDYQTMSDMCINAGSEDTTACLTVGSEEQQRVVDQYAADGYTIQYLQSGMPFASRDYTMVELVWNFLTTFIRIDNPWYIQDPNNPDLERKYYLSTTYEGLPAIKCSGCLSETQLYIDGSFPFIHQNVVELNFGNSFPTNQGVATMTVIMQGQGTPQQTDTTFPTGVTQPSSVNLNACKYKMTSTLDHLDTTKFDTNYADCALNYKDPSMASTSLMFGLMSLIIAYLIAIPAGIQMARKKGKLVDKIGIVYINFLIALPSLAFIFLVKQIGNFFGAPDKFPQYGFGDIRSYVLPVIILALLNTASLMTWVRRYMVDQTNADYVKFAKAKGLSQSEIFNRHILKNAIIPIVNGIPSSVVACLSGSVITESIFSIPGMGKMLPDAIKVVNNNMVITLTFIFASMSILAVLVGDVLMTVIDPRIQLTTKGDTR